MIGGETVGKATVSSVLHLKLHSTQLNPTQTQLISNPTQVSSAQLNSHQLRSTHHGRVFLGVRLPQVKHVTFDHVRNVSPEPVVGHLLGIGVPLDAAQILEKEARFVRSFGRSPVGR